MVVKAFSRAGVLGGLPGRRGVGAVRVCRDGHGFDAGFSVDIGDSHHVVTPRRFTLSGPSGAIYDAPLTTWWTGR